MTTTMQYEQLRINAAGFWNPRTHTGLDHASLVELAIHIGMHGLLNPPLVLEDGQVIAGQRRYRSIGILLAWFAQNGCDCHKVERLNGHAELCVIGQRNAALQDFTSEDVDRIIGHATRLRRGVPVRVIALSSSQREGIALGENLQRSDLSSYEIAGYLHYLHAEGATQADISRLIGKSKTYVSRAISTWRGATPELLAAWRSGDLAFDSVQELAKLTHDEQRKALAAPQPRGRRGPVSRPGIDVIKETLAKMREAHSKPLVAADVGSYAAGVLDALQWVNGDDTSGAYAKLMEVIGAG